MKFMSLIDAIWAYCFLAFSFIGGMAFSVTLVVRWGVDMLDITGTIAPIALVLAFVIMTHYVYSDVEKMKEVKE